VIPLDYLLLRSARRVVPTPLMRWLLRRKLGVESGLETREPAQAAARYLDVLASLGRHLHGAVVMILGYGGSFGLAVELLRRGAGHLVLCDPYAAPMRRANLRAAAAGSPFLRRDGDRVAPDPSWITVPAGSVEEYARAGGRPVDLVFSSSVFEHLEDVGAVAAALASITTPNGCQVHFIDLRDHYFRRPFEMLCHSPSVWERWLDPPSHLNRLRPRDYETHFRRHFARVGWEATATDPEAFRTARPRIGPEFLTGDEATDAVTRLRLVAWEPRKVRSA